MNPTATATLDRIALFAGLPPALKARIAAISGQKHFTAPGFLFREGEAPDFVYAIIDGAVVIEGKDDHRQSVIEFIGPGETILIPFVLLDTPYRVAARATADGNALVVPAARFRELVLTEPALAAQCAFTLSRHWRSLISQISEIKNHNAVERVAHFLVTQAGRSEGATSLILPGMKKEVATRLGIKPETLSRSLKKLRDYGVDTRGDTVRIASIERLAAVAAMR